MRPHAGEGDGEAGLPAVTLEVVEVGGEGDGFVSPISEPEKCADPDAAESTRVSPLWAIEAPVEVFLGAGGVELLVGF